MKKEVFNTAHRGSKRVKGILREVRVLDLHSNKSKLPFFLCAADGRKAIRSSALDFWMSGEYISKKSPRNIFVWMLKNKSNYKI